MIRVCNWRKFQHYAKRNPPWIKLHRQLLDDREWQELEDGPARLLVELWLLGSEGDPGGSVPLSVEDLSWRLRKHDASTLLAFLEVLVAKGFVEVSPPIASVMLA